jgi:hypothetical protein
MRTLKPAVPALLLTLLLTGPAGCNGNTDPGETPTPSPVTPFNAHPSTTAPTPTPTPTGPIRAPDDPDWTENQLAAVRLIDALEEWEEAAGADPRNADQITMWQLTWEPFRTTTTDNLIKIASKGQSYVGGTTPVTRVVGPEQVMDGRREIVVRQCQEDNPGAYVVENGETNPPPGEPRVEYRYVVQWVEEVQGWRVVEKTKANPSC